ncbi:NAD-dependent epimerase/dehydratase family protein [Agarilytica rhodophyticola]|uniref:NAD-dependent epimerase/dehydratase family protein n=1 Tax=Agarilytica rhodophyticola TaxID=1737490 RepID=UPI000B34419C|nr:NAD-dependent epimerase/dehydratase family protein [Agarilytica rhodophyticola]
MTYNKKAQSKSKLNPCLTIGITGCTGSLGQRLLFTLLESSAVKKNKTTIRCLARTPSKLECYKGKITIIKGSLNDKKAIDTFVHGLDVCIHLASQVGYGTINDYHQTNVIGTQNICNTILKVQANCKYIHCSSITVLNRNQWVPFLNSDYANSKFRGDKIVENLIKHQNLNATIVYPGLIYGPQDNNLLPQVLQYLGSKRAFLISGGESNAPLIYIDDLCGLFIKLINDDNTISRSLIAVGPQEVGIHTFIKSIAKELNYPSPTLKLPKVLLFPLAVLTELIYRILRIKKPPFLSKRIVGFLSGNFNPSLVKLYNQDYWKAHTEIKDGLPITIDWFNSNKKS